MGRYIVDNLLKDGHTVRILSRNAKAADLWPNHKVEICLGDVCDAASLTGVFDDIEVVYHMAGKLGQAGVAEDVYENLHYQGTKNVLEAALPAGAIKRFIHCSSAGVQGPIDNPPADERMPYAPSNIYERTKTKAEKLVLQYYKEYNLPVIILRPEFVYGPGDLHVLGLFAAIKKGMFVIFGKGSSLLHPTYIDDCTQAFMRALYGDNQYGEVFIIAGEKPVSVKELAYTIADALGVRRPFCVPYWLGYNVAVVFEGLGGMFGFDPPLNRSRLKFFTENRAFDISKARNKLEYIPKTSFAEGAARTIAWYKENGHL